MNRFNASSTATYSSVSSLRVKQEIPVKEMSSFFSSKFVPTFSDLVFWQSTVFPWNLIRHKQNGT